MSKLSIIIPVYNVEMYLENCLKSIFSGITSDEIAEIEVICVNDGSTDASQKIIDKYKSIYPNIISITKINGGLSSARNAGLEVCTSDYITFMDSDDWYVDGIISKVLEKVDNCSDDIISYAYYEYFNEKKKIIHYENIDNGKFFLFQSCCTKLFKRELVGQIRFPEGLWYEDNDFTYKLIMKTDSISISDEPIMYYRQNRPGSIMSSQRSDKIFDINKVYERLISFSKTINMNENEMMQFEYICFLNIVFRMIPKIIAQNPIRVVQNQKRISDQYCLMDTYFPNWKTNQLLLNDTEDYFRMKIGRNHIARIIKLRKIHLFLLYYVIQVKISAKLGFSK